MIYHVHVPQASTLGPIDKAVVAKPVPVSGPMSTSSTGECRAYVLQAPYCPMTCFVDRRDSHFLSSFRLDTSVVGTVFKRLHGQVPDYASILSTRRWCLCGLWKCLRDAAPRYLADLCVPAHSVHGRQQLRSTASWTLLVPRARTAIYKTAVLVWKCLHDAAPRYLADLCVPAHSMHGRQKLHSTASGTLLVPHARTATGPSSSHLRLIEWLDSRKPFTYNTHYTVSIMQIGLVVVYRNCCCSD